jgi:GNAT superfamily N-acetyltransferase
MPEPAAHGGEVRIETYVGPRETLRGLFALADDSDAQIDSYLNGGQILVARHGTDIVGHLQLIPTEHPSVAELKSMAVLETRQGQRIGAQLVRAAVDHAAAEGHATMLVATATADTGNLRFYQRQGFRFRSIERDAFTPATGYPTDIRIDGILLRDRIWLDQPIDSHS